MAQVGVKTPVLCEVGSTTKQDDYFRDLFTNYRLIDEGFDEKINNLWGRLSPKGYLESMIDYFSSLIVVMPLFKVLNEELISGNDFDQVLINGYAKALIRAKLINATPNCKAYLDHVYSEFLISQECRDLITRRDEINAEYAGSKLEKLINDQAVESARSLSTAIRPLINAYLVNIDFNSCFDKKKYSKAIRKEYSCLSPELRFKARGVCEYLSDASSCANEFNDEFLGSFESLEQVEAFIVQELKQEVELSVQETLSDIIEANLYNLDKPIIPEFKSHRFRKFLKYFSMGLTFGSLLLNQFIGFARALENKTWFFYEEIDSDSDGLKETIKVYSYESTSHYGNICDIPKEDMELLYTIKLVDLDNPATDFDGIHFERYTVLGYPMGEAPEIDMIFSHAVGETNFYDITIRNIGDITERVINDTHAFNHHEQIRMLHPEACIGFDGDQFKFDSPIGEFIEQASCGGVFNYNYSFNNCGSGETDGDSEMDDKDDLLGALLIGGGSSLITALIFSLIHKHRKNRNDDLTLKDHLDEEDSKSKKKKKGKEEPIEKGSQGEIYDRLRNRFKRW